MSIAPVEVVVEQDALDDENMSAMDTQNRNHIQGGQPNSFQNSHSAWLGPAKTVFKPFGNSQKKESEFASGPPVQNMNVMNYEETYEHSNFDSQTEYSQQSDLPGGGSIEPTHHYYGSSNERAWDPTGLVLRGGILWKIPLDGKSRPRRRWFRVVEIGEQCELQWHDPDKPRKKPRGILLTPFVKILVGHHTPAFLNQNPDNFTPPELSFSLVFPELTLNLAAGSEDEVEVWIEGLQHFLTISEEWIEPMNEALPVDRGNVIDDLFRACYDGDAAVVAQIFDHYDIAVDMPEPGREFGETLLIIACRLGYVNIAELCLRYNAMNDPLPYGNSALQVAVEMNQVECAKVLLQTAAPSGADAAIVNEQESDEDYPILVAAENLNIEMVNLLLKHGADIFVKDRFHRNVLHRCIRTAMGQDRLRQDARRGKLVRIFLANGADELRDDQDCSGSVPLHFAAQAGNEDIVKLLLEYCANPTIENNQGFGPYHYAMASQVPAVATLIREYQAYFRDSDVSRQKERNSFNDQIFRAANSMQHHPQQHYEEEYMPAHAGVYSQNMRPQDYAQNMHHEFPSRHHSSSFSETVPPGHHAENLSRHQSFVDEWHQYYHEGYPYYLNSRTHESQWEDPRNTDPHCIVHESDHQVHSVVTECVVQTGAAMTAATATATTTKSNSLGAKLREELYRHREAIQRQQSDSVATAADVDPHAVPKEDTRVYKKERRRHSDRHARRRSSTAASTGSHRRRSHRGSSHRGSSRRGSSVRSYSSSSYTSSSYSDDLSGSTSYSEEDVRYNKSRRSRRNSESRRSSSKHVSGSKSSSHRKPKRKSKSSKRGEEISGSESDDSSEESGSSEEQVFAKKSDGRKKSKATSSRKKGSNSKSKTKSLVSRRGTSKAATGDGEASSASSNADGSSSEEEEDGDENVVVESGGDDGDEPKAQAGVKSKKNAPSTKSKSSSKRTNKISGGNETGEDDKEEIKGSTVESSKKPTEKSESHPGDEKPPTTPTPEVEPEFKPVEIGPELQKYANMRKFGIGAESVKQKMIADGITCQDSIRTILAIEPNPVKESNEENEEAEKKAAGKKVASESDVNWKEMEDAAKYVKMLKLGLGPDAVRQKMQLDKAPPELLLAFERAHNMIDEEEPSAADDTKQLSVEEAMEYMKQHAAKFLRMKSMGVPVMAIRQKMVQENMDEEALNNFDIAFELVTPGQSQKKSKSKRSLVKLHWNTLKVNSTKNTVWEQAHQVDDLPSEEMQALEQLFASKQNAKMLTGGKGKQEVAKRKSVVDGKRENNVSIGLAQFKKNFDSFEALASAIQGGSTTALDTTRLQLLLTVLPTRDECSLVTRAKKQNPEKFITEATDVEKFFAAISEVSNASSKVDTMLFCCHFPDLQADLMSKALVVISATTQIQSSTRLRKIFELILKIGNIMNEGEASGFTLDSLLKLTQTRAQDRKTTVVDYLCSLANNIEGEALLDFPDDLGEVEAASRLSPADITKQVDGYEVEFKKVQKLLDDEKDTEFGNSMQVQYKQAAEKLDILIKTNKDMTDVLERAVRYFGENPSSYNAREMFHVIHKFIISFNESKAKFLRTRK